jgi:uncharacterized protein YlxW (UPF0749 family)
MLAAGPGDDPPPPRNALPMPASSVETIVRQAKQQLSQRDINDSMLKAVAELTKEIKRLEDDIRRVRREVQMGRRFS